MRVTVVSLIVRQRAIERLDHRNGFFTAAGQEIDAELAAAHSRSPRGYYVIVLSRLILVSLAVHPPPLCATV